jgi:chaperonin GroEL
MEQSMSKLVCYGEELRRATLNGASKLNKCVSSTMGPRGRTVILQKKGQSPIVTKDGVSCAEFFELEDPFENASATIIKQAARQSANSAGDGTTTATVLAHSILVQAQPYLAAGISPIDLKRGIDKAIEFIVGELPRWSKPVSGEEDLERIATISANGDKSIGKLIAKAVDLVGKDGSILIQEAKSMHTVLILLKAFVLTVALLLHNLLRMNAKAL